MIELEAMSMPQPGDFQLMPTGGAGGMAIRVAQWLDGTGFADYEHVRLYIGTGYFVEAEPTGARLEKHSLDGGAWSTNLIALTGVQRMRIVAAARACVGVPYSFLDYGALVAHRLHIPEPGLRSYIASSGHMICSQLVDYCYQMAGVQLFSDGRWDGFVTPGDLYELLLSKGLA